MRVSARVIGWRRTGVFFREGDNAEDFFEWLDSELIIVCAASVGVGRCCHLPMLKSCRHSVMFPVCILYVCHVA